MVKLLHGDCLSLMKDMPNSSVDMVLTSPHYDDLRTYNGYSFNFEPIANELYRIIKSGGVMVWVVNDAVKNGSETGTSFRQALYFKDIGFNLHDTMIWNKQQCAFPDKTSYYQCFEYIFVLSKGKPKTYNPIKDKPNKWFGTKVHGTERQKDGTIIPISAVNLNSGRTVKEFGVRYNIWEQPPAKHNTTGHPAVFPLELAHDYIISWSSEDDIVLDPFMGSGTTGIACANTNRKFIGMEISEEYYNIAEERIGTALKEV